MGKKILAIFLGLVTAVIVIMIIQAISNYIYPLPADINPEDTNAIMEAYKNIPAGALILVLISYAFGSFAGGLAGALISKPSKLMNAVIIGSILLIMGIINLTSIPHPVWFWILSTALYIPCSILGAKIRK